MTTKSAGPRHKIFSHQSSFSFQGSNNMQCAFGKTPFDSFFKSEIATFRITWETGRDSSVARTQREH